MIMETLFFASLAFGGLSIMAPSTPHKSLQLPTTVRSPNSSTSHVTNATGDGANVYSVSFVNNNGTQSPAHPQTAYESAQQYFKQTFNGIRLSDITSATYEYCCQNKYYIAASTILGGYVYMFYKLRVIQSYMDNQLSWGAWKKDVPIETLLATPQDKLTQDLMTAIQERYISIENPTDSLTPLISFSTDITAEKELMATYHRYVSLATQCSLNTILPFSQTLLAQLTERKQRITYLSTLFQSWLAHYKLEQIKHSRSVMEIPFKEYRVDLKA